MALKPKSDRMLQGLLVAAVLLPLAFYAKGIDPVARVDAERERFFVVKVNFPPDADVLFVGHSRVMRDISPAHFTAELPELKARNYAFPSLQLDRGMLSDIDALLPERPGRKMIVMEFSPWVLPTVPPIANSNKMVYEAREHPALARWLLVDHLPFYTLTRPMTLIELWLRLSGGSEYRYLRMEAARKARHTRYHDNGWAERVQASGFSPDLPPPRAKLKNDPAAIDAVCDQIRKWRQRDILVFGIQAPVGPKRKEHEQARFAASMPDLIRLFTEAGGEWIDIPHRNFRTYDGSHLGSREAIRYTRTLARRIGRRLGRR